MSWRCSTSLAATGKREAQPASSACNECSTTATSKICSAISQTSNSFSPATTFARCWSCASLTALPRLSSLGCHPSRSNANSPANRIAKSKDPYQHLTPQVVANLGAWWTSAGFAHQVAGNRRTDLQNRKERSSDVSWQNQQPTDFRRRAKNRQQRFFVALLVVTNGIGQRGL